MMYRFLMIYLFVMSGSCLQAFPFGKLVSTLPALANGIVLGMHKTSFFQKYIAPSHPSPILEKKIRMLLNHMSGTNAKNLTIRRLSQPEPFIKKPIFILGDTLIINDEAALNELSDDALYTTLQQEIIYLQTDYVTKVISASFIIALLTLSCEYAFSRIITPSLPTLVNKIYYIASPCITFAFTLFLTEKYSTYVREKIQKQLLVG
ncbi:MAG: hypothetical protein WA432_03000 [Candidatus Babeliaceae bacterium]